jgi:allophanate hydrolase
MAEQPIWIHRIPEEESAARLAALHKDLPLYGLTFAIKDNIDLAGVPTTAGCPAYAYTPSKSAVVVERLMAAGAIPVGKTNLDQFATGLVGTRSPYGACSSVFDSRFISGGSSSGSAVAVAAGLVDFSLGTDTAGSGRVPAAFNGIVGLKPTRGSISNEGVVPACATLDCVSIFAKSAALAWKVYQIAGDINGQQRAWPAHRFRFGVPTPDMLQFFGDEVGPAAYEAAAQRLEALGGQRIVIDYTPFRDAANLLYSGPWVAERLAAIREFAAASPDAIHPITAKIILGASKHSAVDTFEAIYKLADLARAAQSQWKRMDLMLLPTAGRHYTHEEVAAEPFQTNTNLGYYTNFVNLLDLAAIAIPVGKGVTLIGPAWSDAALAQLAQRMLGEPAEQYCPQGYVPLAVCGAHLSGQPLNHQLTSAGAFLIEATHTAPEYRFYALKGTKPAKPGLARSLDGGAAIEVEVWAVPESKFGPFVAAIPPPLAIGSCTLASGRQVKSFVCEPWALADAEEITHLGGWRAFVAR